MSGLDPRSGNDPAPEPSDTLFPVDRTVTSLFGRGEVDTPGVEEQAAELFPEAPAPLPVRAPVSPRPPEPEPEPEPESDTSAAPALERREDPAEPTNRTSSTALPIFPALTGLRGVAVAVVVLYDARLTLLRGGGLGISTLFTLSGFLAVAGLLAERGESSTVDLLGFWTRRARRVLGPALAVLAVAGAFGLVAAVGSQRRGLVGDGVASLLSIANWRFILDNQPFGPALGLASPMRQFWALSVIGQLLIVIPLLLVGLLGVLHWTRTRLAWVLAGLIVVSVGLGLLLADSPTRVLYGTDTRAAELLAGCLLAVVIYDPWVTIRLAVPGPVREAINVLGVIAGLGLVGAWIVLSSTGGVVLHGGLALMAVLSSLVVVAAILPEGPVSWTLSRPALQGLGRIAIVLYLVHWPVFVWIDTGRTGLGTYPLLAVRLAVVVAVAVGLQWASERLQRRHLQGDEPGRTPAWMGAVATVSVIILLLATSITATGVTGGVVTADASAGPATTGPPPTVAFYGDALASGLEASARTWSVESNAFTVIPGATSTTCGLDHDANRRLVFYEGQIPPECSMVNAQWATAVTNRAPDVAVVVIGLSELSDHQQPSDGSWLRPGDSAYDDQLSQLMTKAAATLTARGTRVLWVNLPAFTADAGPGAQAARVARFNELIQHVATSQPGTVTIADLATWAATQDPTAVRPSSSGFTPAEADRIMADFLGPALLRAAATGMADPTATKPTPTTSAGA
jgi:peptidoglycan/LPS O-acetylase OafA/YrhL